MVGFHTHPHTHTRWPRPIMTLAAAHTKALKDGVKVVERRGLPPNLVRVETALAARR